MKSKLIGFDKLGAWPLGKLPAQLETPAPLGAGSLHTFLITGEEFPQNHKTQLKA